MREDTLAIVIFVIGSLLALGALWFDPDYPVTTVPVKLEQTMNVPTLGTYIHVYAECAPEKANAVVSAIVALSCMEMQESREATVEQAHRIFINLHISTYEVSFWDWDMRFDQDTEP